MRYRHSTSMVLQNAKLHGRIGVEKDIELTTLEGSMNAVLHRISLGL